MKMGATFSASTLGFWFALSGLALAGQAHAQSVICGMGEAASWAPLNHAVVPIPGPAPAKFAIFDAVIQDALVKSCKDTRTSIADQCKESMQLVVDAADPNDPKKKIKKTVNVECKTKPVCFNPTGKTDINKFKLGAPFDAGTDRSSAACRTHTGKRGAKWLLNPTLDVNASLDGALGVPAAPTTPTTPTTIDPILGATTTGGAPSPDALAAAKAAANANAAPAAPPANLNKPATTSDASSASSGSTKNGANTAAPQLLTTLPPGITSGGAPLVGDPLAAAALGTQGTVPSGNGFHGVHYQVKAGLHVSENQAGQIDTIHLVDNEDKVFCTCQPGATTDAEGQPIDAGKGDGSASGAQE